MDSTRAQNPWAITAVLLCTAVPFFLSYLVGISPTLLCEYENHIYIYTLASCEYIGTLSEGARPTQGLTTAGVTFYLFVSTMVL